MSKKLGESVAYCFFSMTLADIVKEGGLFGKKHVLQGDLYMIVGGWLSQSGGTLGYGLRDHPVILGKLLGQPTDDHASNYVQDVLRQLASQKIEDASGKDKTLFDLFVSTTLDYVGFELKPNAKWMNRKIHDLEGIWRHAQIYFQTGVGVGFHFPEEFQVCWANSNEPQSKDKWDELYRMGIVLTPEQEILILEEEVCNVLTDSADWVEETVPSQLTREETSTLRKLASS